jgi:hypothetical protein
LCSEKMNSSSGLCMTHILAVPSSLHEARIDPEGSHFTLVTSFYKIKTATLLNGL